MPRGWAAEASHSAGSIWAAAVETEHSCPSARSRLASASPIPVSSAKTSQFPTSKAGADFSGSGCQVIHTNDGADVVAFQRYDGGGDVTFVIANLSATNFASYTVGMPQAGNWYEILTSDETAYLGSGVTNGTVTAAAPGQDGMPAKATIQLPPRSILVFSQTDVPVALSNFILE